MMEQVFFCPQTFTFSIQLGGGTTPRGSGRLHGRLQIWTDCFHFYIPDGLLDSALDK